MNAPVQRIRINPFKITKTLLGITGVISLIHIAILITYYRIDDENVFDFVPWFDMDYEANLPTLFTALLFFVNSLILLCIALLHKSETVGKKLPWFILSFVFLFLCLDESTKIHEYAGDYMENFVTAEGYLYFPWFIPYMTALAVLCLLFLPFFLSLPVQTKKLYILSLAVFLTGAVFLDILGAEEADNVGTFSIRYSVLYTIEEILEMLGLIVFLHANLAELVNRNAVIEFSSR